MGWTIRLVDETTKEACLVNCHEEGSTVQVGGSDRAEMNVTYNYKSLFDFTTIDGLTGAETVETLWLAVQRLGTKQDRNYWARTPGNAGHACSVLFSWAHEHPKAKWEVQ